MIATYISYIFAVVAVIAGISTILQKNPVHSAVSLVVVMLALAVQYLILQAEFIFAIQIIVYAGAVMVMFVFVIMFLNLGDIKNVKIEWSSARVLGGILAIVLLLELAVAAIAASKNLSLLGIPEFAANYDSTRTIGKTLFSEYLLPFELISVVLIIGIIGAVVLGKKKD